MKEILDFLVLGIIMAVVVSISLLLKDRYGRNLVELSGKAKTYTNKQIIIGICVLMPIGLYIVINFPVRHLVLFELIVGTMVIGFTAYILAKNKVALLLGVAYPLLYYGFWNNITLNVVALFIAMGALLILNRVIKPKQMLLICSLLVVYDAFMVYVSRDMVTAAHKIVEVELPMYVAVQCTEAPGLMLGLGDVMFFGLLAFKFVEWKGLDVKSSIYYTWGLSTLSIACIIVMIELIPGAIPATIPIMIAAAITIVLYQLDRQNLAILTGVLCGVLLMIILKIIWV